MNVLIAVASKHGATKDIADEIARVLETKGIDVTSQSCDAIDSVAGFDAIVVGSAVYAGHWRPEATSFVTDHATDLEAVPVWLFSSGPLGDPPKPDDNPIEVADLTAVVQARGHALFAGRLDAADLSFGEKAIVKLVKAPYGDFRPWDTIDEWSNHIADVLSTRTTPLPLVGPDDGRLQSHTDHELRPD